MINQGNARGLRTATTETQEVKPGIEGRPTVLLVGDDLQLLDGLLGDLESVADASALFTAGSGEETQRRPALGGCDCALRGFSPAGIAQLLESEGKSCLLRLRSGFCRGDLVFSRGRLVNASISSEPGESGENAALTILAWESADLHILDLSPIEPAKIHRPLSELILEAAHLYDEQRRGQGQLVYSLAV